MIVLDASVVVELLLWTTAGQRVGALIRDQRRTLHAPHLLDVEVAQVLRRVERLKQISATRASAALEALSELDAARYDHTPLLSRMWQLRRNCTAYDACYLALAEVLGATLLTADKRLASVPGARARVQVV